MHVIEPLESWDSEATLATFHTNLYHCNVGGRTMQKSADDMDRYREIIHDTNPELIIETGTRYGGSALWFHLEFGVEVLSIDIDPKLPTKHSHMLHPGISYLVGNTVDPIIMAKVQAAAEGRRVMVTLDSDHHAPHVLQEIELYGKLVSRGCFMVVEDACFDMWTGEDSRRGGRAIPEIGGTLKAIRDAGLDQDPRWKRDVDVEEWTPISHSPCGWWEAR